MAGSRVRYLLRLVAAAVMFAAFRRRRATLGNGPMRRLVADRSHPPDATRGIFGAIQHFMTVATIVVGGSFDCGDTGQMSGV